MLQNFLEMAEFCLSRVKAIRKIIQKVSKRIKTATVKTGKIQYLV